MAPLARPAATVRVKPRGALAPSLSVAVAVKAWLPTAAGVPVSTPVAGSNDSHAGNAPCSA